MHDTKPSKKQLIAFLGVIIIIAIYGIITTKLTGITNLPY